MTGRRRSSIAQEKETYKEAQKQCKEGELIVGCDDKGDAVKVDLGAAAATAAATVTTTGASSSGDDDKQGKGTGKCTLGKHQNLFEVMNSMLNASSMIYTLASLRKLAKQHAVEKPGWFFGLWGASRKIELEKRELILATEAPEEEDRRRSSLKVRFLKRDVSAKDISRFVDTNLKVFDALPNDQINTNQDDAWNIFRAIDYFQGRDAFFSEFDDEFSNHECVYAVIVNRDEQRVTVVFRGSVTGGKDWSTNFNTLLSPMDPPKLVKQDEESNFDETILVHRGFKSYLFDETLEDDKDRPRQKYDDVIDDLRRIFTKDEFKNYELYVTGHSLGGALCTLIGFKLAGTKKHTFLPKPVTIISYAAPKVGDQAFNKAFQLLEKKKLLRAIRVSNQGDLVPVAPPSAWPVLHGFTQTGINMHLLSYNPMQVGYRNLKYFVFQSSVFAAGNHSLVEYRRRANRPDNVEFFLNNTIDGLYEKEAGDCTA